MHYMKWKGECLLEKNRKKVHGDGVAVYLKDNISWKSRLDLESEEIENIWIEVLISKSKTFMVGIVYRPQGLQGINQLISILPLKTWVRAKRGYGWRTKNKTRMTG